MQEGEGRTAEKNETDFVHGGDSCGSSKWRSLAACQICGVGRRTHLGRRVHVGFCATVSSGSHESSSPHQAKRKGRRCSPHNTHASQLQDVIIIWEEEPVRETKKVMS